MDQKALNKKFIIEFIEMYRQFPYLWRIKSLEYRDRNKKNAAYEVLLEKYKDIDINATIQTIKNKIDSLRGAFRKELKKVKDSQRSGAGADDIYKPHLWYFQYLSFLTDQETARTSISSMDTIEEDSLSECSAPESQLGENVMSPNATTEDEDISLTNLNEPLSSPPHSSSSGAPSTAVSNKQLKRKYEKPKSKADEVLEKVSKQLDHVDSTFDITAKNIANKLKTLSPETAIITEKLLTDILFEAQMGNVTRYSKVVLQDSRLQNIPNSSSSFQTSDNTLQYYSSFGNDLHSHRYD